MSYPRYSSLKEKLKNKYNNDCFTELKQLKKEEEGNIFKYIRQKLIKAIDSILLIDLNSSSPFEPNSFLEILLYWVYSKIEIIIVIAFIINMCVDASVISMVYPISYFGYALLEYPFTNKYYWKLLTIYSLITIVLKLFYQLPFICGYPFLAIFNPFNENYCESYNLSETDFLDNVEYFIGFRKYNGEYSYPRNAGLLSGILWDVIILFLLLCNRSLLKSKGIWNFVDIYKEFTKVPVFLNGINNLKDKKHILDQPDEIDKNKLNYNSLGIDKQSDFEKIDSKENQMKINVLSTDKNLIFINNHHKEHDKLLENNICLEKNCNLMNPITNENFNKNKNNEDNDNSNTTKYHLQNNNNLSDIIFHSHTNITLERRAKEYFNSLKTLFGLFFRRLVPELYHNEGKQISKPGVDYYPHSFACLLVILIYTLFAFGNITGRNGQSFTDVLEKQQFSKDLVWTTIIIIFIIVVDRVIYKHRSVNTHFIFDKLNIKLNSKIKGDYNNTNNDGYNMDDIKDKESTIKEDNQKTNENQKNNSIYENDSQAVSKISIRNESNDYYKINKNNKNDKKGNDNSTNNSKHTNNLLDQMHVDISDVNQSNIALIVKLVLHYALILFTHYFIFIKLPIMTRIYFFQNSSLIFLYILCCIYFYLTSLQIKYGFPLITKGQYFANSVNYYNRLAFKIYRNVPFLYELRAILDWTITKTSLDLFQWFKLEDAYANLYEVKCDMAQRKERKKIEDRSIMEKFFWGFCFFLFLMFIIILPMILFSSFNPNLKENKVLRGKFSVNLELRNPELDITTFSLNLFQVNTLKINKIKDQKKYEYLRNTLIPQVDDVEERKIQKVKIINFSQLDWILSPPTIGELLFNLQKKTDCYINIEWEFMREFPQNSRNIQGIKQNQLNIDQIALLKSIIFSLKTHQKPEQFKLDIKGNNKRFFLL